MSISRLLGLQVHGNYLFRNNNAKHWYINNLKEKNIFFFVFGIHVYTRDRYFPDEPTYIKSHKAETERHSIA